MIAESARDDISPVRQPLVLPVNTISRAERDTIGNPLSTRRSPQSAQLGATESPFSRTRCTCHSRRAKENGDDRACEKIARGEILVGAL